MIMAFTSISKEDLKDRGVTGLPDTPQLTTEEMQRKFDELAKEVLVPAFNKLVEELAKETAAANIGITIPEGLEAEPNIAAIIEWLLKDSGESDRLRHSHDNKSILDSITSNVKSGYDNLVNLLSSIEEISNVVKNSENSLPTGSAIVDYMIGLGGGDMLRAVYDSNCSGIVDDSEKLGGKSPKFYEDAIEEVKEMAKNGGKNLIGDEFVSEKDYFTGDYAIKDNVLYRFVQDKAVGTWDETAVESTTIEAELHALNAKMETVWNKVFPPVPEEKYFIRSGALQFGKWSWSDKSDATGSAYQSGAAYCLSVAVPGTAGRSITFSSSKIDTDGLDTLKIVFSAALGRPEYNVNVTIKDQDNKTLKTESISLTASATKTYDISSATGITVALTVSMAGGTNVLKISNIVLV